MDRDGNVKTLPLFADIDVRTPKYTFSHRHGLLFATHFAQIALVVTEKAVFEDMRMKGFVQKDCAFVGHSLGEYSALASIADVLHISALVERDSENRSNYAMRAVNPSRISSSFSDAALREVVDTIATFFARNCELQCGGKFYSEDHRILVLNDRMSGSTICLCWRASHLPDYDQRPQLPQAEN